MEENKNAKTAAAAETAIDSIKKLLDAVGNDEELKQKLEAALAALSGEKTGDAKKEEPEKKEEPAASAAEEDAEEDDDSEVITSSSDLSDIFNEDAVAGMVVGFVAGVAVVGGGVLLHKLIAND
ncbi:MAG: hypothetical protein IJS14_05640 [Lentisphaeria bacterium]|nr:hypothetical protein [Lentisphaeria bacterium]